MRLKMFISSKKMWLFLGLLSTAGITTVLICVLWSKDGTSSTPRGVVVSNAEECAKIGGTIFDKGGNAVEVAISVLLCEGIALPQSMGLGGGFMATFYLANEMKAITLDAREVAPAASSKNMFNGDAQRSKRGGLSVAVPGELRGYWYAYNRFRGKLSWRTLIQPTIDLCRKGVLVTSFLARVLKQKVDLIYKDPLLKEIFVNSTTNRTYEAYDRVKRLKLAETLDVIANEGGDALYNGSLVQHFVEDIQKLGGIVTVNDMKNFKPEWQDPVRSQLPFNQTLYTTPLPGSGLLLAFIFNILKGEDYLKRLEDGFSLTSWQRIIESFKYAYGARTQLGDPKFVNITELVTNLTSTKYADKIRKRIKDNETSQNPSDYGVIMSGPPPDDHGTAHICVLSPKGDAVSVTSTVNLYLGAAIVSPSTGIILNDEMDDFSSPNITNEFDMPPFRANIIEPGKRPLSSMAPSIIVDNNGEEQHIRLIIGGAGGTKITTAITLAMLKHLWLDMKLTESINDKRLHHQLFPMTVQLENPYRNDTKFIEHLEKIGHTYTFKNSSAFSAITAISRDFRTGAIQAATDVRRPGGIFFVY